jgi:hypothetical protein
MTKLKYLKPPHHAHTHTQKANINHQHSGFVDAYNPQREREHNTQQRTKNKEQQRRITAARV